MSTSVLKKQALLASLKRLMEKTSYEKISVTDICTECKVSRKSFYYHFEDKDALLKWAFYFECGETLENKTFDSFWPFFEELSVYFYNSKKFYVNLVKAEPNHTFRNILAAFLKRNLKKYMGYFFERSQTYNTPQKQENCIDFLTTIFIACIENWIKNYPDLTPSQFIEIVEFNRALRHRL